MRANLSTFFGNLQSGGSPDAFSANIGTFKGIQALANEQLRSGMSAFNETKRLGSGSLQHWPVEGGLDQLPKVVDTFSDLVAHEQKKQAAVDNVHYSKLPEGVSELFYPLVTELDDLETDHETLTDAINYFIDGRQFSLKPSDQKSLEAGRADQKENEERYRAGKQHILDVTGVPVYSVVFDDYPEPGEDDKLLRRMKTPDDD